LRMYMKHYESQKALLFNGSQNEFSHYYAEGNGP
jgi:hypothetical protein